MSLKETGELIKSILKNKQGEDFIYVKYKETH